MFIRPTTPTEQSDHTIATTRSLVARLQEVIRGDSSSARRDRTEAEALKLADDAERRIATLENEVLRLQQMAMTDELTGLLNRRGFHIELRRALSLARRHGETGVLVMIDLDGFKLINDSFGHAAGDKVLHQIATVLAANVRDSDVVARVGGDEFAVLMLRSTPEGGAKRSAILERLLNTTAILHSGHVISVRASVGHEVYGPDSDADALIAHADADMYHRKRRHAAVVAMARSAACGLPHRPEAVAEPER